MHACCVGIVLASMQDPCQPSFEGVLLKNHTAFSGPIATRQGGGPTKLKFIEISCELPKT